ncbi:uncharacterized protein LOC142568155 [Dermacentor variabilis]|uniref:uncharacterized protein LOC142568155 n=1 Tax=Dermacentor variabilis TaxID=34621 RepID=UPI003F5C5D57
MPKRKRYKHYLYDATCDVPLRTLHRQKIVAAKSNSLAVPSSCDSGSNVLHSDSESDTDTTMAELPSGDDNEICSLHSDSDNFTNQSSDGSYTSSDDDDDCEPRAGEVSASELEEPLYQDAKLS